MVEATKKQDIYKSDNGRVRFENGYAYAKKNNMTIPLELELIYNEIRKKDFRASNKNPLDPNQSYWLGFFSNLGLELADRSDKNKLVALDKKKKAQIEQFNKQLNDQEQKEFDYVSFMDGKRSVYNSEMSQTQASGIQEKQQSQYDDFQEETKDTKIKQKDPVIKKARSVIEQLQRPFSYDIDDLNRQIQREQEYQNLTNEQRQLLTQMTKVENLIISLSKYVKLDPDSSFKKTGNQLEILGKYYPIEQIIIGVKKLLKDVSNLSGNIDEQKIGYQTKKQPFKKVLKMKEQTKFKPTLNQLFQTRKVMC